MTAEVIVLLLGLILILLTVIDGFRSKNGASSGIMSSNLRVPLGILGVVLVIYSGFAYGAVNPQGQIEQADVGNIMEITTPVDRIQIISPLAGDSVKCRVLTMGVYPEGNDKDIWVLLQPSDGKYYPQSDHTNTSFKSNGEWQVITRFGGDQGEAFDVVVYETDPVASAFFSKTIVVWNEQALYPGLEETDLPTGAREVDRITVTLMDECRGIHETEE